MQLLGNGSDSAWPTLGLWLHLKISIRLLSLRMALSFSSTWSHFVIWKTRGAWISFSLVFWMRLALWVASRFWKWCFSQREVLKITNKKCLDVVFSTRMIRSASPYLFSGQSNFIWWIQSRLGPKLRIIFRCGDRAIRAFRCLSSDLMSSPNNGRVSRTETRRRRQRWWHSSPCTVMCWCRRGDFLP